MQKNLTQIHLPRAELAELAEKVYHRVATLEEGRSAFRGPIQREERTSETSNIGNPTSSERQRGCRGVTKCPLYPDVEDVAQKKEDGLCDLSEVGS